MSIKNDTKLISLQTTGCYGYCPVYTLTVFNSGKLLFEPQVFTYQTDTIETQISQEELGHLRRIIKETNLMQYPDRFESTVVDAPLGILKIYYPEKSVKGSIDRPKPLLDLEQHLKDLGKAHDIETVKGRNPKDAAPENAEQLIVRLKESVNAGNWIAQFGDMKVRLIKRIPSGNTWVVEYDNTEITEAQFLDILKDDEMVEAAQRNIKTEERE